VAARVRSHDELHSHIAESCVCHDHDTPCLSVVKAKKMSCIGVRMRTEALVVFLKWIFAYLQAEPDIGALLMSLSQIVRFY
jgi:hypothetical protein